MVGAGGHARPGPDAASLGDESVGLSRAELDVTDAEAVRAAVAEHGPDVVVNCAALHERGRCRGARPRRRCA